MYSAGNDHRFNAYEYEKLDDAIVPWRTPSYRFNDNQNADFYHVLYQMNFKEHADSEGRYGKTANPLGQSSVDQIRIMH